MAKQSHQNIALHITKQCDLFLSQEWSTQFILQLKDIVKVYIQLGCQAYNLGNFNQLSQLRTAQSDLEPFCLAQVPELRHEPAEPSHGNTRCRYIIVHLSEDLGLSSQVIYKVLEVC